MTSIQWTDETWNPTTGCTKVSPGCAHCYIERTVPFRIHGRKFVNGHIPVELHMDRLDTPLHWKRPRRVFVNSLSDLFHEDVPTAFVLDVFNIMRRARWHQFQVLTKRPRRMRAILSQMQFDDLVTGRFFLQDLGMNRQGVPISASTMLKWVWLGVSVENRAMRWRIDELRETPAAVRFLSLEPLLEDLGELDLRGIHWVILGGESGPQARPCDVNWIRSLIQQCRAAGVAPFVKQLGRRPFYGGVDCGYLNEHFGGWGIQLRDKKGGDMNEWPENVRVREYPVSGVPARAGE